MAGIGRCSHELICSVRIVDPRVDDVALVHVKNSRSPGLENRNTHAQGVKGLFGLWSDGSFVCMSRACLDISSVFRKTKRRRKKLTAGCVFTNAPLCHCFVVDRPSGLEIALTPVLGHVKRPCRRHHQREPKHQGPTRCSQRTIASIGHYLGVRVHADPTGTVVAPGGGVWRRRTTVEWHPGLPQVLVALWKEAEAGFRRAEPQCVVTVDTIPLPLGCGGWIVRSRGAAATRCLALRAGALRIERARRVAPEEIRSCF